MLEMMDNPMFLSQMNEAMNNPQVVDMMMQNPMVGLRSYLWIIRADMW
jgi:ubiquilin